MTSTAPIAIADLEPVGKIVGTSRHGKLHELSGSHVGLLLKRYEQRVEVDVEALDSLIRWRLDLDEQQVEFLDNRTGWPLQRVVDGERTVGVMIPRPPRGFTRGLQQLVPTDRSKVGDEGLPPPPVRARIVRDLASTLDFLASSDLAHGEITPRNVLWDNNPGKPSSAYLQGCDGVVTSRQDSPLPPPDLADWTDPRIANLQIDRPDPRSDIYALAMVYFRCYYTNGDQLGLDLDPETLPVPTWPPSTPETLELVTSSLSMVELRPKAQEWAETLTKFIDNFDGFAVDAPKSTGAERANASPGPSVGQAERATVAVPAPSAAPPTVATTTPGAPASDARPPLSAPPPAAPAQATPSPGEPSPGDSSPHGPSSGESSMRGPTTEATPISVSTMKAPTVRAAGPVPRPKPGRMTMVVVCLAGLAAGILLGWGVSRVLFSDDDENGVRGHVGQEYAFHAAFDPQVATLS